MEVKYRIIDVNPNEHSITVRYYTDLLTQDMLATSMNTDGTIARKDDGTPARCQTDYHINIWQTNPPLTLDQIKQIANDCAPYDWFRLKHDIADANVDTSLSEVSSIINQEFSAVKTVSVLSDDIDNENIESEIQKIIDSITSNSDSSSANT